MAFPLSSSQEDKENTAENPSMNSRNSTSSTTPKYR